MYTNQTILSLLLLAGMLHAPTQPKAAESIITQPQGTMHADYIRSSFSMIQMQFKYAFGPADYVPESYVKGEDGTVYLQSPFVYLRTSSYLKLTPAQGDTLVCHLPQPIYNVNGEVCYAQKLKASVTDGAVWYSSVGGETSDFKFVLRGDTLRQVDVTNDSIPEYILGLADASGEWLGVGDANIMVRPTNAKSTSLPAGLSSTPYVFNYTGKENIALKTYVELAFDNDGKSIYMTSPYANDSTQWIKGTITDDSKVVFRPQYIGVNNKANLHLSFLPATYTQITDPTGAMAFNYTKADSVVFALDKDTKTLSKIPESKFAFLINCGTDEVNALTGFRNPDMAPFNLTYAIPNKPMIHSVTDYDADYGYGFLSIDFFAKDKDGNDLSPTRLFYNIFIDDDAQHPVTFDPSIYATLKSPMTNIPFEYSDNEFFFCDNEIHNIYFSQPFKNVGIQLIYNVNGKWAKSELVWWKEPTGIDNFHSTANGKTQWFDLSGRRVTSPQKGFYIKRTVDADGNVHTEKTRK